MQTALRRKTIPRFISRAAQIKSTTNASRRIHSRLAINAASHTNCEKLLACIALQTAASNCRTFRPAAVRAFGIDVMGQIARSQNSDAPVSFINNASHQTTKGGKIFARIIRSDKSGSFAGKSQPAAKTAATPTRRGRALSDMELNCSLRRIRLTAKPTTRYLQKRVLPPNLIARQLADNLRRAKIGQ